jgi:hypothetical protein
MYETLMPAVQYREEHRRLSYLICYSYLIREELLQVLNEPMFLRLLTRLR